LFTALAEFEQGITSPLDVDAIEFRQMLSVMDEQGPNKMPTTLAKMVKPMPSRFCQILGLYKLVDVLHSIYDQAPRSSPRNPRYSRMAGIGVSEDDKVRLLSLHWQQDVHPFSQCWPMDDWVSNLRRGSSFMDALATLEQGASGSPSSAIEGPLSSGGLTLECRLFKDLHGLSQQHSWTKLLFNVQLAAIHLFFLLKGNKQSSKLVCIERC
jgi:hypothetical protein